MKLEQKSLPKEEALLRSSIRAMYAKGMSEKEIEFIINKYHQEIKVFFNKK